MDVTGGVHGADFIFEGAKDIAGKKAIAHLDSDDGSQDFARGHTYLRNATTLLGEEEWWAGPEGMSYADVGSELAAERFMREYYLHARTVYHLVELAFKRLNRKPRNSSRSMYLERGVAAIDG